MIQSRDRRHAALATARLVALGGRPVAHVDRDLSALCGVVSDPGISDRSKIALLLARFPPLHDAPLDDLVRRVEGDAETHALLETIGDDERASLGWLRRMSEALAREGT